MVCIQSTQLRLFTWIRLQFEKYWFEGVQFCHILCDEEKISETLWDGTRASVSSVEFMPIRLSTTAFGWICLALHAEMYLHCIILWVFRTKFLIAQVRAFTMLHEHKIMVLDLLWLSANSKHNLTTEGSPRAFCVVCIMEQLSAKQYTPNDASIAQEIATFHSAGVAVISYPH